MTDLLVRRAVEVTTKAGLHARPAADFAAAAAGFAADVRVAKADHEVDGASVLSLLTLDVRTGDTVTISADGPDAATAVDALCELVTAR